MQWWGFYSELLRHREQVGTYDRKWQESGEYQGLRTCMMINNRHFSTGIKYLVASPHAYDPHHPITPLLRSYALGGLTVAAN
jgi:hypothetical protein